MTVLLGGGKIDVVKYARLRVKAMKGEMKAPQKSIKE